MRRLSPSSRNPLRGRTAGSGLSSNQSWRCGLAWKACARGALGKDSASPDSGAQPLRGCPLVLRGPRPQASDLPAPPGCGWRRRLPQLLCVAVKRLSINRVWIVEQSARFVCLVVRGSKVGIVLLRTIPSSLSRRKTAGGAGMSVT